METAQPNQALLSPAPTGWSPDGTWFWDGRQWNDAISRDGKWRFDGREWQAFDGQRPPMPAQAYPPAAPDSPPPPPPRPQAAPVLPTWVAQSEVERLEQERIEAQQHAVRAALPPIPAPPESHLIMNILLWTGVVLGAGILLFGLLGVIDLSVTGRAEGGSVAVGVIVMLFGLVFAGACVIRLMGYVVLLGPVGTAFSSLGILGCLILLGMVINTIAAVSSPYGGRYVIPWATIAVVGRRALQGRWLAAMIIGGTWLVGVLLILTVHPQ